jgi:molybdenum cofactor synthesis domain-containing protein
LSDAVITAGLIVIGDEILSGRTKDRNIGYVADFLTNLGIDLGEVRVVPDVEAEIIAAVEAMRPRYRHVLTTGGIGPTRDDITADSIAKAFGVTIDVDPRAAALLQARYGAAAISQETLRMARIPAGATLILNSVSAAPGFSIGNVHVMAGVPPIMQAMLDDLAPRLGTARRMLSRTVTFRVGESRISAGLRAAQADFPDVLIGSYPGFDDSGYATQVVLRCRDEGRLAAAELVVIALRDATA